MDNEILFSVIFMGAMAMTSFTIAYHQSKEKGFIFTNRWLYAIKM